MGRVLIIGAGGVGTVVAHKVAQNADVFTDIMIASRTKEKCDKIVEAIGNPNIKTAKVDADNVEELVALFNDFKPEMVINVALPYQDLTIMEACLKAGVNYLDTANYEPKDEAHFEYSWQWAYHDRFKEAGLEEAPVTWDDLKADAKALTGNGSYGYSCPLDQWYYMSLVMNAGGTIFNETEDGIGFAGDPGTKPLYMWKEMIADGTMHVPSGQDYNSSEACRNAFAGGTAAMIQQSSAQLKGLEKTCEFEVGVGAVPQDTTLSYPAGGSNLLMFKGHSEEEEKAGWEFLKYMTNTENAVRWANGTGYLPTRQSCIDSEEYKKMVEEDPNLQIIVDQVQYSTYKTPFIPQYQEAKEIFANEIQKCILEDNYTPEQAVSSMEERVAKLFK